MMRLLLICLLLSTFAAAQPGYTPISTSRYNWTLPSRFSGGLHIPAGVNPSLGAGQYVGAGAVYVDTTGADAGLYYYINGAWVAAGSGVDSLRRLPGSLNVQALKGGTWRTQFVDSSGGSTNSNVGTGYRLVVAGTNDIKTLFYGHGLIADSTTSANGITARADTSTATTGLATIGDVTRATANQQKQLLVSKGVLIGNSTIAAYSCGAGVETFLMTKADSAVGTTITNDAVPGHTIAQQRAVWEADANRATYDWIMVEIGLNDLDPTEAASVALARYQRLIDTINAQKKASAVVITVAMTPCKQRLIDLYGGTDGAVAYTKWLAMNNAIMGGQPGRIIGSDYRINSHVAQLGDGMNNLSSEYDCGDGIHETNEARKIIANAYRQQLNTLGFLMPQTDARNNQWSIRYQTDANGQAGYAAINDIGTKAGIYIGGSSFGSSFNLHDRGWFFAKKGVLISSDAFMTTGGTSNIIIRAGGYQNPIDALTVGSNSLVTLGAGFNANNLGSAVSDTTTWKPVVRNSSGDFKVSTAWYGGPGGGGSVTPAALTKTDDTNVTLTLGGTPLTALLQAASITAGWTGTLADGRIASASNWNTAYTNRITSLTTTGSAGPATLTSNVLNIPNYTLPSLTSGSVIFSNGSTITQDNANFFWDNTNKRLGIGTATPSYPFELNHSTFAQLGITGGTAADVLLKHTGASTNEKTWGFRSQGGVGAISSYTDAGSYQVQGIIAWLNSNGNVGISDLSPGALFSVAGKLHFNSSGKIAKYANTSITNGKILIGHTANGTFELGNIASANSSVTVTNNAGGIDLSVSTPTESTYTPTLTNTSNVSASTAYAINYYQSGNTVWVWGDVSIDATAALTITEMGFSLPVPSNFTSTLDLSGHATFEDNTTMQIKADATNDRAVFRGAPQTATNNRYSFTLTYKVIN